MQLVRPVLAALLTTLFVAGCENPTDVEQRPGQLAVGVDLDHLVAALSQRGRDGGTRAQGGLALAGKPAFEDRDPLHPTSPSARASSARCCASTPRRMSPIPTA